ncbi:anti-sigma factor C-terminal domain-containing protein [Anaerobacillus sp. CMMVII]|uniref:anti-sigma factor C-terminal domain-containing protein n=1 Tax=Anaerobacillus sp. CMMVII TaxID=2755588 RepID=UPI0021B80685|nr:anti-sigma factor C-terminal domain-containing protein [Anaerobacillus sp. CMMVII]
MHEGTVADFAFSTKHYFTTNELFDLLEGYDLTINWMPIYMGELDRFSEGWWGSDNSISVGPWGLTHGSEFRSDYHEGFRANPARENIEVIERLMINNMKQIYKEDQKLTEAIFNTKHFEERIQFIEENGFLVYGAVVTGPTKELLRLKELEEIQGVQLGEITFWNW